MNGNNFTHDFYIECLRYRGNNDDLTQDDFLRLIQDDQIEYKAFGISKEVALQLVKKSFEQGEVKPFSPGSDTVSNSTGWAVYADTSGTPLVVTSGGTTDVLNNAGSVDEAGLLAGDDSLYDGSRIIPHSVNDSYDIRLTFKAASSTNNGDFAISLDISALGDGSITVASNAIRMVRGSNQEQVYTVTFPIYCKETFKANGGLLRVEAINGDLTLTDISLFVVKTHSGG